MKKIADISAFESLMNESCHHVSDTMKSDVVVFNNVDNIRSIVESYGFELRKYPFSSEGTYYRIYASGKVREAVRILGIASELDHGWFVRNIDSDYVLCHDRDSVVIRDGEGTNIGGVGVLFIAPFDGSHNCDNTRGYFHGLGFAWNKIMRLEGNDKCSADEFANTLDERFPKEYQEYVNGILIPELDKLQKRAEATVDGANKWFKYRAGVSDDSKSL